LRDGWFVNAAKALEVFRGAVTGQGRVSNPNNDRLPVAEAIITDSETGFDGTGAMNFLLSSGPHLLIGTVGILKSILLDRIPCSPNPSYCETKVKNFAGRPA
jgi:hypothetical protein